MSEQLRKTGTGTEMGCQEAVSGKNTTELSEAGTQITEERFWQEDNLEQRVRERLSRFAAELKQARRLRENS